MLSAQEHLARGEAVGEMKADGIDYDERMELLDDVTWPKPLEELLEHTYAVYRQRHPWVAEDALSPKSVVRDMYERAMTFSEYVAFYGLTRSEGLVLRYLGDAYRALRQTVPESVRTEELDDIDRVARHRRPPDRLEPARRVGAAHRPRPARGGGRSRRAAADAGRITANERALHACWCATRCSAGSSWPPCDRWEQLGELEAEAGSTMGARGLAAPRWRTTSPSTTPSTPVRTPAGRRCC